MNKKEHILAQRYATAYLNIFSESLHAHDIPAFQEASQFFKEKKQACFLFDLSLLSYDVKQKALNAIVKACSLPKSSLSLFSLVIADKRSLLLSAIFDEIAQLYKKQLHLVTMNIESSVELSSEEKNTVKAFLEEQLQSEVTCFYAINQRLIAGIRMANNQYVWERSVQAQLKALQSSGRR